MNLLAKEIRIGIVIVVGFIVLILGVKYLKGLELFSKGTNYYVVYDRVDGLTAGSPIVFRGFKVGSVRQLALHPSEKGKILVTCLVTEEVVLANDTKAELYSADILGAKGINLIEGKSSVMLMAEDTLFQSFEPTLKEQLNSEIGPIKQKMERVMERVDTLLLYINHAVDPKNPKGITQGFSDFSQSMSNLKGISSKLNNDLSNGGSLDATFRNVDTLTTTLSLKSKTMSRVIDNLDTTLSGIKRANLEETIMQLKSVLAKSSAVFDSINNGQGSVGMLINDKELYYSLLASSENLDRLLVDVRQNPKRYVSISAFDFSDQVYLSPKGSEELNDSKKVFFSVELDASKEPLDLKSNQVNNYTVVEKYYDKMYHYLVANTSSFVEVKNVFESVNSSYPKAQIVAFQNEKPISIKKAMKLAVE